MAAGLRAGMALVVPLYKTRKGICDRSMELQDAMSELDLAEKLVTAGAMSNAEYLEVTKKIKKAIFK